MVYSVKAAWVCSPLTEQEQRILFLTTSAVSVAKHDVSTGLPQPFSSTPSKPSSAYLKMAGATRSKRRALQHWLLMWWEKVFFALQAAEGLKAASLFSPLTEKAQRKLKRFVSLSLLKNTCWEPEFTRKTNTYSVVRFIKSAKASLETCFISLYWRTLCKQKKKKICRFTIIELRGAWSDRDTNDIFAHCSLIFCFLDFKFSNFFCPSELHPSIWFFLKNSFRKKKNIRKTTKSALAPSIFIVLSIVLKLGTPLLHIQAQNSLLQNF